MMENECPLCRIRVNEWQMVHGKAVEHGGDIYHKSCLIDYKLRRGEDHPAESPPIQQVRNDWSVGLYET